MVLKPPYQALYLLSTKKHLLKWHTRHEQSGNDSHTCTVTVQASKSHVSWQAVQQYAKPDALPDNTNLQLHRRSATRIATRPSTTNVGIPFVRENVLPNEELWVLRLDNRDLVNSQCEVIMEL